MRSDADPSRRRLLPAVTSEEGHRVTTLELFFDLAYVFAFTQVSGLMAQHHNAVGVLQALVVLALLWWSWTAYGWLANQAHADEGVVRVAMIVAMTAVFVAGLVVREAYDDLDGGLFAPLVFVGAYLVARITHAIVYLKAAVEDDALRRGVVATVCLSLIPSSAVLVTGALLGSPWQVWCWLAAIAIEPIVADLMSRGVDWRVHSATHFAERYGLVVILALGESIIAIGVGVSTEPISSPILVGAVLAILISVGMWWAYFSRLARLAEHALADRRGAARAQVAIDGYTYLHLVLVAGIVFAALGVEDAMAHIAEVEAFGLFGAAALGGGVACYIAGTGFFARRVIGDWWALRFAGASLLLAAVAVLALVPPIAALAIVAGLLLALLVIEGRAGQPSTSGRAGIVSTTS
jgi:low temperature requirement protein LtrA